MPRAATKKRRYPKVEQLVIHEQSYTKYHYSPCAPRLSKDRKFAEMLRENALIEELNSPEM